MAGIPQSPEGGGLNEIKMTVISLRDDEIQRMQKRDFFGQAGER